MFSAVQGLDKYFLAKSQHYKLRSEKCKKTQALQNKRAFGIFFACLVADAAYAVVGALIRIILAVVYKAESAKKY